jgi:hypothetical protein
MYVCKKLEKGQTDLHFLTFLFLRPGGEHRKTKTPEKCPEFKFQ